MWSQDRLLEHSSSTSQPETDANVLKYYLIFAKCELKIHNCHTSNQRMHLKYIMKLLATMSHYTAGGKYCRRCEYVFVTQNLFCECCGMRLRASPTAGLYKEKVRAKKKLTAVADCL
jgi:hypothetical protein